MSIKVLRRHHLVTMSPLLGLLVWGGVAVTGAESRTWDPFDDTAANIVVRTLALPSLPTPRVIPREKTERIPPESLARPWRETSCPFTSLGFPAECGTKLLTFVQTRQI
jgi:hypothetical protein